MNGENPHSCVEQKYLAKGEAESIDLILHEWKKNSSLQMF